MYMQVRSQKDQLHSELEENKRFIEVLKQICDNEREKTEAIDDELTNAKECVKMVKENVKELEKIWNDTKLSLEKLFSIAEVCSYVFNQVMPAFYACWPKPGFLKLLVCQVGVCMCVQCG